MKAPITHARRCIALSRIFLRLISWVASISAVAAAPAAMGQVGQVSLQESPTPTVVVVGFVGGFVRRDDDRHPEVRIIEHLSEKDIRGLHATVYENRRRAKARQQVLHWLDTNGDGRLSMKEKQNARIILFGHSWGGSATHQAGPRPQPAGHSCAHDHRSGQR